MLPVATESDRRTILHVSITTHSISEDISALSLAGKPVATVMMLLLSFHSFAPAKIGGYIQLNLCAIVHKNASEEGRAHVPITFFQTQTMTTDKLYVMKLFGICTETNLAHCCSCKFV